MKKTTVSRVTAALLMAGGLLVAGCGKQEAEATAKAPTTKPASAPLIDVAGQVDWCKEHGVPESICVQCHPDLAEGFKKKNDWCAEHKVPDSQCFKHHPELKDKFAAAFKEKYGKEPPVEEK